MIFRRQPSTLNAKVALGLDLKRQLLFLQLSEMTESYEAVLAKITTPASNFYEGILKELEKQKHFLIKKTVMEKDMRVGISTVRNRTGDGVITKIRHEWIADFQKMFHSWESADREEFSQHLKEYLRSRRDETGLFEETRTVEGNLETFVPDDETFEEYVSVATDLSEETAIMTGSLKEKMVDLFYAEVNRSIEENRFDNDLIRVAVEDIVSFADDENEAMHILDPYSIWQILKTDGHLDLQMRPIPDRSLMNTDLTYRNISYDSLFVIEHLNNLEEFILFHTLTGLFFDVVKWFNDVASRAFGNNATLLISEWKMMLNESFGLGSDQLLLPDFRVVLQEFEARKAALIEEEKLRLREEYRQSLVRQGHTEESIALSMSIYMVREKKRYAV